MSELSNRAQPVVMVSAQAFPLLGGIESHVDEVSRRLVAAGVPLQVWSTDRCGELPREEIRAAVTQRRFRAWPRARDYFASPGLFTAILRARCCLVHVQGIHTLVPPIAMLAAAIRRIPFVLTFHTGGNSSRTRTRLRGLQFRLLAPLLRRAAALIAVSEYEAQRFADVLGVDVSTVQVIRNGGLATPTGLDPADPDLIVSVGRLERYKGHHRAIEALPHLRALRPGAHLRILGAGPYRDELLALAERLDVADAVSIEFVPPQQRDAMARALSRATVVSLLSDYESHPVAVMEALAVGRPVIALDNSGVHELVTRGLVHGLPDDAAAEAVAAALFAQLENPCPPVTELPTWDGCAREVAEVYRRVLAGPTG
jgi:glycosyltransferase involved in cell wall biosynthesis